MSWACSMHIEILPTRYQTENPEWKKLFERHKNRWGGIVDGCIRGGVMIE